MPRLILQPLVENAIYHGIKPRPEGGCIIIRGFLRIEHEQREIILEVSDDGVGMPKDKLERIFEGVSSKLQEGGVGVRNVQERIALYAGEQYGLEFRSEQEAGTTVRVRLPVVAQ
jgi:two-component system sensor histidine kinase YesM